MPYPYSYFKPTGKEQAAMAIGSLLAGALAAAQPRQEGEASPALKGITGAVAGYGGGYKTYQDMMGDAWQRDLHDKKFGQDVNQFDQQMELGRDKFGEEKRQYKESELPYKQSATAQNNAQTKYYNKGQKRRDWYTYVGNVTNPETGQLEGISYNAATNEYTKKPLPLAGNKEIHPKINPTLSESAQENIARGDTLQQNINRVRDLYKDEYVGMGDALQGKIGETFGRATSDDEKQFRAAVNSLYTNMFAEGGKALTENEKAILKSIFPSLWRGQENFQVDLSGLETKYKELMDARLKTHKDAGMRNIDMVQKGLTQSNSISLPEGIKTYSEAINHLTKQGMSPEQAVQWIKEND